MRIPRTSLATFLALTAVVWMATASFAPVRAEEAQSEKVSGEIKEIGVALTFILEEKGGSRQVFATNAETTIVSGGKKIRYEDLEVGWRVTVDADTREDVAMATHVEVVAAP